MNNKMIEDFAHRYRARIVTSDRYNGYSRYGVSMHHQYYYDDPSRYQVEIEMPHRSFDQLVHYDHTAELEDRARQQEATIRQRNPAVAKAYEQYKMLLALCR